MMTLPPSSVRISQNHRNLGLHYSTETIFALIESPSDKHQRHARRYSTNVSRIHTAIRQKSAAYTPLFNKCQRHTHRYLTNVSGIHRYSTKFSGILTAIRQMSAVYTPLYSTRSTCTAIYIQRVLAYTFSLHLSPTNLRQFAPQHSGIYTSQKRPSLNLHQNRICASLCA